MNASSKDLLDTLVEKLSPLISSYGFQYIKSKALFKKTNSESVCEVIPYFNTRTIKGLYNLGFRFNVRINRLEDIVNSCKPYMALKNAKQTVSATGLLLNMTDRKVSDWNYSSGDEIINDFDNIYSEVEKYGIDFLNRFSHIEELIRSLESDDGEWPVSLEEDRAQRLLALYVCVNRVDKFNTVLPVLRARLEIIRDGFYREYFYNYVDNMLDQYPEFRTGDIEPG